MNKLLRKMAGGLAGILLLGTISGCLYNTRRTWTEITGKYERSKIIKEDKTLLKSIISEKIDKISQDGYEINAFINEKNTGTIKYIRHNSIESICKEETFQDKHLIYYGNYTWPEKVEGSAKEKVMSIRKEDETGEREEEAYSEPRPGIPVMFSSDYFKFSNNSNQITSDTDKTGKASAKIISGPQFWRAEKKELEAIIKKGFEKQIKYEPFINKFLKALQIKEADYNVTVETCKKDSISVNAGYSIPQKAENTKDNFTVKGYEPNFTELYQESRQLIKKDLEEKYVSTIKIKIRDTESHVPISSGAINLATKKAVKLQELINAEITARGKYFVEGSGLSIRTKVDPSYLLVDLDKKQIQISTDGIEIKSTRGFTYNIEYIHPEYNFLTEKLSFDEKSQSLIIDVLSLGSKIRKGDLKNISTGIKKEKQ